MKLLLKQCKYCSYTSYTVVSHEVRDCHVSKFTVFIVLKLPMKQRYKLITLPLLDERSSCVVSFCSNRKLHMPGHMSSAHRAVKARILLSDQKSVPPGG